MILALTIALVVALVCSSLATRKHRSPGWWFAFGFLFSVPALLALCFLPDMQAFCPGCGAEIEEADRFCPACGNELPDSYARSVLGIPPEAVDGQCPACRASYSLADYRPDARIACSRCGAEIEGAGAH